jgi:hypothetical protein
VNRNIGMHKLENGWVNDPLKEKMNMLIEEDNFIMEYETVNKNVQRLLD